MIQPFNKISKISGKLKLPGDKSISHRALIFSSLAAGESIVKNCLNSADIRSTIECFQKLGCDINQEGSNLKITGRGFKNFIKPEGNLNAGNSGTTARLISGILANQNFETSLIGDESLTRRPMDRIIDPLLQMGAVIEYFDSKTLPLKFYPSKKMQGIEYELPVASAQVKSAVILSGLHMEEETIVVENICTRNHTENMLDLKTISQGNAKKIYVSDNNYPQPKEYFVPSDISSAAYFIVLALLTPNSDLIIKDVLLNETRGGILKILQQMGGKIEISNENENCGEVFGDLRIQTSHLKNIKIESGLIPNIIDEIPVLAIAGIFAEGDFEIRNAAELRIKESDRISSLCRNFEKMGLEVEEYEDGFRFSGEPRKERFTFESFLDHRIAMAFAVYSLFSKEGGEINNFQCVEISNPDFIKQVRKIVS